MCVDGSTVADIPESALSERDIVRLLAAGHDPATVLATDIAGTKLVRCDAEATVDEVAAPG